MIVSLPVLFTFALVFAIFSILVHSGSASS